MAPVRDDLAGGGRQDQPDQPQRGLRVLDVLGLAGVDGLEGGGGRGVGLPRPRQAHPGLGPVFLRQTGGDGWGRPVEPRGGPRLQGQWDQAGLHTQHCLSGPGQTQHTDTTTNTYLPFICTRGAKNNKLPPSWKNFLRNLPTMDKIPPKKGNFFPARGNSPPKA